MTQLLATTSLPAVSHMTASVPVPQLVAAAGAHASKRFVEFFTASIRNPNTRNAYQRAVTQFFDWCDSNAIGLLDIEPVVVAAYVELLMKLYSKPTVKQHLAAIRMLFDYLVIGHIVPFNPAAAVRGPKHVVKKGKTPVLDTGEARELLDSIDTSTVKGLRDKALIGVLIYSFARISATLRMDVEDMLVRRKRVIFRLHEKGGKLHEVPAHHNAEAYLDDYVEAAGIADERKSPLFRSIGRDRQLTSRRMDRRDAFKMMKRRAEAIGLSSDVSCHSFRATGITAYLANGGSLEHAMQIACHESARTTKLYDRTNDDVSLDEIERIII